MSRTENWVPRVKIFAGKAAASYHYAKLIIKLINDVADTVNNDPDLEGRLKIAFLPDYNVSLAEVIIPAADLSEQISTAGMEASGTGNMKLALNGALTIGTLDGANIEIRDHVGAENIAIFGMEAGDVMVRRKQGLDATDVIKRSPRLSRAIAAIENGEFSQGEPHRFARIAARTALSRSLYGRRRFQFLLRGATRHRRALAGDAGLDPRQHSQRGADGRGFRPTAPSANMPRMSGTCRCGPRRRSARQKGAQRGGKRLIPAGGNRRPSPSLKTLTSDVLYLARSSDDDPLHDRRHGLHRFARNDGRHGNSCSPRRRIFSTTRQKSPPVTADGRGTPARITGPLSARSAAVPPPPSCAH